jgi:hypothetical protein
MKTFSHLRYASENPEDLDPDSLLQLQQGEKLWRDSEVGRAYQNTIDLDDEADLRKEKKTRNRIKGTEAEQHEVATVLKVLRVGQLETNDISEEAALAGDHGDSGTGPDGAIDSLDSDTKLFARPPKQRRGQHFLPGLQEPMNPNPPSCALTFTRPEQHAAVMIALEFLAKFLMRDKEPKVARFCLELRNRAAKMLGIEPPLHIRDLRRMRMDDPAFEIGARARWISW